MHSSAGSTKSNRAKTRRMRIISRHSEVDETLFGTPSKGAKNVNVNNNDGGMFATDYNPQKKSSGLRKPKKETVQVITKDLIRNLM